MQGKRISVIGAARSGLGAAGVLQRLGAKVLLSDSQSAAQLGADKMTKIAALGVQFAPGASENEAVPPGTELVIVSPGVPKTAPVLRFAQSREIPVWSEIELASRLAEAPIVAITGTNGKTTTTLLTAAILKEAGWNAVVAGNVSADEIKKTLVDAAYESRATADTVLVAEVSSFQLEWVERFAPRVGILTNVTPDHLNRYADFTEYAQTKARLFAAQTSDDWAILNHDDPIVRAMGESRLPGRRLWVTLQGDPPPAEPCARVEDGWLTVRLDSNASKRILRATELPASLPGIHSVFNALAAAAAATILGANASAIASALQGFSGVAHRMEFVADVNGVRYINNSMCTNVAAAIASLESLELPAIIIAGGADKGLDFAALTPALLAKAREVILIGSAADKMESTFRAGGYAALSRADSLEKAVQLAAQRAVAGDAVALMPACASFDMFRDFEERGIAFRRAVLALVKETP